MHRSGTSLTANFLNSIGVDLGQDLLPADEWNAGGYWESKKIYEIHEMVLQELNCNWHNPPMSLPDNWWRTAKIQEIKGLLLEFVRSECKRTEKIWGFKDPRTAIVLPMWQEVFDELQLEPLYILTIRHPGSVAASLSKRDLFSFSYSQALWLKTNLNVLLYTGTNLRAIVDYDRWFDSGLEQARTLIDSLDNPLAVNETQIIEALNRIVLPGLRHHSSDESVICSPGVTKFYSILLQASLCGNIPHEISDIAATFGNSMELLRIWNDMIAERDAIIAERDDTIMRRDMKIERLRGHRKLLIYIIISLITVFSIISSYELIGVGDWFK